MVIEQDELIKQPGSESQELAAAQALDRQWPTPFKEVREQAVERFASVRAQLGKHTADFDATIGMGIRAAARGDQFAVMAATLGPQVWSIVMLIAQDRADLRGQLGKQQRDDLTVRDVRAGELGGQRNMERAEGHRQVQLPAVPPAMPARLAPMRFGINGGMGDDAGLPIFLMPDAAVRAHHGTITGGSVPVLRPRIEDGHQVAPEPATEPRQRRRQGRPAPFPGAARRKPLVLGQQRAQLLHDRVVLLQKGQQRPGGVQSPNDHDHQRFDEQLIGIGLWTAPRALSRGWRKRQGIDQAHQANKNAVAAYHSQYLLGFELGTEMWGRRTRTGKSGTRSSHQFNN